MRRFIVVCASVVLTVLVGFAFYSFVWQHGGSGRQFPKASVTVKGHVYTLHSGDVIRVPAAATECQASGEAGVPNLFCERRPEGKYEVVFYKDSFLVWSGPEKAVSYSWQLTKK